MPSRTDQSASTTSAGITTDAATGERHIPASKRADGSQRREIRIRPGYRPPEDVEVYKNRTAEAWKTRGLGGVPGAEGLKVDEEKGSASSTKNAKRREARRKAKAAEVGSGERQPDEEGLSGGGAEEPKEEPDGRDQTLLEGAPKTTEDDDAERTKRVRKLRKKLREARELEEKKAKGEGLLQEQFDKVIKINELIRDLSKLGFNADGEPTEGLVGE